MKTGTANEFDSAGEEPAGSVVRDDIFYSAADSVKQFAGMGSTFRLAASFASAVQAPEIKAKLVALGVYPLVVCGADFAAYLRRQYDEYGQVIREANIKGE